MEILIQLNGEHCAVNHEFSVRRQIREQERAFFGITDEALKAHLADAWRWRRPDAIWVCPPTHGCSIYEDAFAGLECQPVQLNLRYVGHDINVTSEEEIVCETILRNDSRHTETIHASLAASCTESISQSWSDIQPLSVGTSLAISVNGCSPEALFQYSTRWGESANGSRTITLGTRNGLDIELEAGQIVKAALRARRVRYEIRLKYLASLSQQYLAYYQDHYRGHRIWAPTVPRQGRCIYQTIRIAAYGAADIVVTDEHGDGRPWILPLDAATAPPGGD